MKILTVSLALLLTLLPAPSHLFAADPASQTLLDKQLAEIRNNDRTHKMAMSKGKELAAFCALCHGEDGNSSRPEVPHLAAQNAGYLLDQIERFADGRRNDYIMSPLAKRFTTDEKVTLVVYYNAQKRRADYQRPSDPSMVLRGRGLYTKNCASCHGPGGRGKQRYSYVAGQPTKYVASTLTHFREKTGGRNNSLMTAVASNLSNDDIDALSAFISNLQ